MCPCVGMEMYMSAKNCYIELDSNKFMITFRDLLECLIQGTLEQQQNNLHLCNLLYLVFVVRLSVFIGKILKVFVVEFSLPRIYSN